jgi:hypothetical protein
VGGGRGYWWRSGHAGYLGRRRGITLVVHGFLGFIVFNAAVVFVSGPARQVGVVVATVLVGLMIAGVVRRGAEDGHRPSG